MLLAALHYIHFHIHINTLRRCDRSPLCALQTNEHWTWNSSFFFTFLLFSLCFSLPPFLTLAARLFEEYVCMLDEIRKERKMRRRKKRKKSSIFFCDAAATTTTQRTVNEKRSNKKSEKLCEPISWRKCEMVKYFHDKQRSNRGQQLNAVNK